MTFDVNIPFQKQALEAQEKYILDCLKHNAKKKAAIEDEDREIRTKLQHLESKRVRLNALDN